MFYSSLRALLQAAVGRGGRTHPATNRALRMVGHLARGNVGITAALASPVVVKSLLALLALGVSRSNATLALQLVVENSAAAATHSPRLAAVCGQANLLDTLLPSGLLVTGSGAADCIENTMFILCALADSPDNALKRQLSAVLAAPTTLLAPLVTVAQAQTLRDQLFAQADFCFDFARVLGFCCRTSAFLEALLQMPAAAATVAAAASDACPSLLLLILPAMLRAGEAAERSGEEQTALAVVAWLERLAAGARAKRRLREMGAAQMLDMCGWVKSATACGSRLYRISSGINLCT